MTDVKRRMNVLLFLVSILLIFQFIAIIYFYDTSKVLRDELNATKNQLQEKINENYLVTQEQIDKLKSGLTTTQKSINELKAAASADFSGIIEQSVESIVSIKTDAAQGSGFIISSDGYLITNAHVLSGAHYAKALTYGDELKDATLIGYNLNFDIALLKIQGSYDYLQFGDSNSVRVGEKVIAVGNPYGLSFTVTEGIVSAVNRKGVNDLPFYIQTDVPLNPGNSGGPLIDKEGEVIGVTNFKVGGAEALGFALDSNHAIEAVNNIALTALNQTLI
ncbi:MAG: trypsin-like peptidase domain-containing protein [Nanoarchaeota archaeon]